MGKFNPPSRPQSAHLEALQKRAAELREQLRKVETEIEVEEQRLQGAQAADETEPAFHKRPSYSLLGGEATPTSTSEATNRAATPATPDRGCLVPPVEPQDWVKVLSRYPKLDVGPIGSFNHWDRRECAVKNPQEWKDACTKYMKGLKGNADIPKVIHQIWIGPREPPCLWIDTFRVEYLAKHPEWGFHLWSDEEVATLPMVNEQIYREEKMWQCKADILRLEFLWHYGGLYVDADMISVEQKSLDQIVELGKETGWVIAYEPDTKDKPYSILGNSVIACTPHHPLTLMLILYLKQTFYQKRNHIEVFAVTGPVMYTKCLVDSGMPISIAAQELLYPAFHYVPNPDAINFSAFPKCLMFQFGYTCSGLEGYVKSNNRCKKARICPFHSKKQWPMGPFRELISDEALEKSKSTQQGGIPKVIHQLVFHGVDSQSDPARWRQTWWDGFCRSHPGFQYKTWSKKELEGKSWFCANLYVEPLDDQAVTALMMEVIFNEGGFYVPLSSLYDVSQGQDTFFTANADAASVDYVVGNGGVFGAVKNSPQLYKEIMTLYHQGAIAPMAAPGAAGPRVKQMGFRDSLVSRANFAKHTKYLAAPQMVAVTGSAGGAGDDRLALSTIGWAYECQVPCLHARGSAALKEFVEPSGLTGKTVFVFDQEFFQMDRLKQEFPGFLDQMGSHGWDAAVFGVEWSTGSEEVVMFDLIHGGRPKHCKVVGFVANFGQAPNENALRATLQACVTEEGFDPSPLFEAAGRMKLKFVAEKYAGTIEEARIFRSMPTVHRVFMQLAQHDPPMHFDRHELHGNLMKAHIHGSLRFELILEPNGGIMFRCWNDDNSTNCEMKMNERAVEWLKIYANHQVAREMRDQPIP
eukprot:TRINITY_DN72386_c0_g1_i1.p1 TRINITY_DN72386_c0_g1~~TRINITY_DN72386_c0_g1_i1.p1  ORF type:complete len:865 (-),score=147.00 TRINITY_DN72386_c0_g1_i1:245-2839(-)